MHPTRICLVIPKNTPETPLIRGCFITPKIAPKFSVNNNCSTLRLRMNTMQNCTKWVLDYGATDHMTGNQELLNNYRKICDDQFFTVANNEKIKIEGWDIISIFPKRYIQNVFHVDNCSIKLLSISKLSKDLNCEVIFKRENVFFQDLLTKEKICEDHLENGLYFFSTNKFIFNIKNNEDLCELWHKRVGHPSNKIFKFMFDFSKDYSLNCEVCSLAKHTKLLFYNSNSKSNEMFELVHSDIWGPAPVISYNDYICYVIFIDEFSKIT
jgi:GAG-pre-integrase domain